MTSAADRVAVRAASFTPARVLLSVVASPVFAIGFLVGLLFVAAVWVAAAAAEGFDTARASMAPHRDGGD